MTSSVLIVDDEEIVGRALKRALAADDLIVEYRSDPEVGLELLKERHFDILVTDLVMPGINGISLMRRAKQIRPRCEVVIMTAYATVETAREALKRGAVDILTKPFSPLRDLKPIIRGILNAPIDEPEQSERAAAAHPSDAFDVLQGSCGDAGPMADMLRTLPRIARSDASVLIRGESGVGKELVASALHQLSSRADAPFVCVNCAALPETLLASELFGTTKGAYTGSDRDRIGLFEAANGGTLLLDEIGELSVSLQPKLLRVLQDGEFFRIGDATRPVRVDVRVLAATNRNIESAISTKTFRSDLYYRLNVIPLAVPPLRERPNELRRLIDGFTVQFARGAPVSFHPDAVAALERYSWPGNVRELANAVQHALVLSDGERVEVDHLPIAVQDAHRDNNPAELAATGGHGSLEEIEIRCIVQALVKTDFNRASAARLLGLTRRALGYRIHKYELESEIADLRNPDAPLLGPFPNNGDAGIGDSSARSSDI
ncbi:MAG: sigma-54 dependent transcriptional regulator [Myxococcota bacterium]